MKFEDPASRQPYLIQALLLTAADQQVDLQLIIINQVLACRQRDGIDPVSRLLARELNDVARP